MASASSEPAAVPVPTSTANANAANANAAKAAAARWTTRLTRQVVACRIPIMGAPMAGHAGGALAAAVCRAGALGFVGVGHWLAGNRDSDDDDDSGLALLDREIQIFRQCEQEHTAHSTASSSSSSVSSSYPLCLGFIGYSTFASEAGWRRFERVLQTYRPTVVQFFAPTISHHETHESNIVLSQRYGAKVYGQVGTVQDALEAVVAGVDGLILQGMEAGGHGLRTDCGNGTLSLAANVLAKLRGSDQPGGGSSTRTSNETMPILAAGGIADGYTMAAALALGCDGVVVGTRLCASHESLGRASFKELAAAAETTCDDVVRTTSFDAIQNVYADHPWPEPYDSVGAVKNETFRQWQGQSVQLASILNSSNDNRNDIVARYQQAQSEGNANVAAVLAGQGVGLIHGIEPAHEIVTRMSQTAATVLQSLPRQLFSDS
jgi:nitronate monooxygenase